MKKPSPRKIKASSKNGTSTTQAPKTRTRKKPLGPNSPLGNGESAQLAIIPVTAAFMKEVLGIPSDINIIGIQISEDGQYFGFYVEWDKLPSITAGEPIPLLSCYYKQAKIGDFKMGPLAETSGDWRIPYKLTEMRWEQHQVFKHFYPPFDKSQNDERPAPQNVKVDGTPIQMKNLNEERNDKTGNDGAWIGIDKLQDPEERRLMKEAELIADAATKAGMSVEDWLEKKLKDPGTVQLPGFSDPPRPPLTPSSIDGFNTIQNDVELPPDEATLMAAAERLAQALGGASHSGTMDDLKAMVAEMEETAKARFMTEDDVLTVLSQRSDADNVPDPEDPVAWSQIHAIAGPDVVMVVCDAFAAGGNINCVTIYDHVNSIVVQDLPEIEDAMRIGGVLHKSFWKDAMNRIPIGEGEKLTITLRKVYGPGNGPVIEKAATRSISTEDLQKLQEKLKDDYRNEDAAGKVLIDEAICARCKRPECSPTSIDGRHVCSVVESPPDDSTLRDRFAEGAWSEATRDRFIVQREYREHERLETTKGGVTLCSDCSELWLRSDVPYGRHVCKGAPASEKVKTP